MTGKNLTPSDWTDNGSIQWWLGTSILLSMSKTQNNQPRTDCLDG